MEKIPDIVHESWHTYLQPLFDDKKMVLLNNRILPNIKYYPASEDIFRVFSMPLNEIKVVILGQDPYPNGEAIGYAFAVKRTVPIPKSLQIIKSEICNSKVERHSYIGVDSDRWRELSHWRQQGVFLLNSALTVEAKNIGSHLATWEWFTKEVIKIISKRGGSVWLLWGSHAKGYKSLIHNSLKYVNSMQIIDDIGDETVNYVFEANHPNVESYKESQYRFYGCNHFNLCNAALKALKKPIINW